MTDWTSAEQVLRVLRLWLRECPTDKRLTLIREQVEALVAPLAVPPPSVVDVEALRALPRYSPHLLISDHFGVYVKWADVAALLPPQETTGEPTS